MRRPTVVADEQITALDEPGGLLNVILSQGVYHTIGPVLRVKSFGLPLASDQHDRISLVEQSSGKLRIVWPALPFPGPVVEGGVR